MNVQTASEIKLIENAGQLAAETLYYTGKFVKPGITTLELDAIAIDFIKTKGALSACLGYEGFPKNICTSVNEVICHGLPDNRILNPGDFINIDVTVIKD